MNQACLNAYLSHHGYGQHGDSCAPRHRAPIYDTPFQPHIWLSCDQLLLIMMHNPLGKQGCTSSLAAVVLAIVSLRHY